jgi:hypothetical protein
MSRCAQVRPRKTRATGWRWLVGVLVLIGTLSGCSERTDTDDAALDWRYASFELVELTFGNPEDSITEGVDALPGPAAYSDGNTPVPSSDSRYGSFAVLAEPSASYVVRYAAGVSELHGTEVGTLVREGLAFADGDRVVGQWLNGSGVLLTAAMEVTAPLPMSDPTLAAALSAMDQFVATASSVDYTISYDRLWTDTASTNRGTGVTIAGDQSERWTGTVSSDLVSSGTFATSNWTIATNGRSNGALSHVEWRWTADSQFLRAGCSDAELQLHGWLEGDWDADEFANLTSPGYVPALLERVVEPVVLASGGDGWSVGFTLRRGGLSGEPWPLWSYGDEWDTGITVDIGPTGEPQRLMVESSRGPDQTSGAATDVVTIDFVAWNEPIDVDRPADLADEAPWPAQCTATD